MTVREDREWTIDTGASSVEGPIRVAIGFRPETLLVTVRELRMIPDAEEYQVAIPLPDFLRIADEIRDMAIRHRQARNRELVDPDVAGGTSRRPH